MTEYIKTEETMYKDKDFKPNDTVKMYKERNEIEFPMILLTRDKIEQYRVKAMQGVLYENPDTQEESYAIYLQRGTQAVKVGYIPQSKLGYVLYNNVFAVYEKKIYLDSKTVIKGDMMFALCPPNL